MHSIYATNAMFNVIPVIMGAVFILVLGFILVKIIKGAAEWSKNNNSPQLAVMASIVTKREKHTRHTRHSHIHNNIHHQGHGTMHGNGSTVYFATFQFESGDRIELKIPEKEYGLLAEGDFGKLTFQGTRFLNFERDNISQTI